MEEQGSQAQAPNFGGEAGSAQGEGVHRLTAAGTSDQVGTTSGLAQADSRIWGVGGQVGLGAQFRGCQWELGFTGEGIALKVPRHA